MSSVPSSLPSNASYPSSPFALLPLSPPADISPSSNFLAYSPVTDVGSSLAKNGLSAPTGLPVPPIPVGNSLGALFAIFLSMAWTTSW